jgi:hypothetical protein
MMGNRSLLFALVTIVSIAGAPLSASARYTILWLGATRSEPTGADANLVGDEARFGTMAGASGWWPFSDHIDVELGALYTERGSKGKVDTRFSDVDTTAGFILNAEFKLNYIDVPLLLGVRFEIADRMQLRAYGGASANFLVKSEVVGTLDNRPFEVPIEESVKGMEWGAVAGANFWYGMDTVSVLFDFRWTRSLDSILEGENADLDIKNNTFAFNVGLAIPITNN